MTTPTPASVAATTVGPRGEYDLRTFFRNVGQPTFGGSLNAEPPERRDAPIPVEMVETGGPVQVGGHPLDVAGYVDGVQSSLVITHRGHRPVYLCYQSAGAVGQNALILGLHERLRIVCSETDRDWVSTVNSGANPLPVTELAAVTPPELETLAYGELGRWRETLERRLVEDLVDEGVTPLIVDGSLQHRPVDHALHGVVKNVVATKYLPDESVLYGLDAGWRSPIFRIPQGSGGCQVDRYSCYLRLHDASARGWSFGLIRLEAFSIDRLDELAARAMAERQSVHSGDGRFDRHLASVAVVEKVLRARRPTVFDFH